MDNSLPINNVFYCQMLCVKWNFLIVKCHEEKRVCIKELLKYNYFFNQFRMHVFFKKLHIIYYVYVLGLLHLNLFCLFFNRNKKFSFNESAIFRSLIISVSYSFFRKRLCTTILSEVFTCSLKSHLTILKAFNIYFPWVLTDYLHVRLLLDYSVQKKVCYRIVYKLKINLRIINNESHGSRWYFVKFFLKKKKISLYIYMHYTL